MLIGKKKKKTKNKDGEFEDEEDEVMMAQLAAKGAGTLQYTKPEAQPLVEIEKKPDPQESEEWKKFNALLNKTSETVAATQTKMNQLADQTVASTLTGAAKPAAASPGPAPDWESFQPEQPAVEVEPVTEASSEQPAESVEPESRTTPPPEPAPVLEPIRTIRTPSPEPVPARCETPELATAKTPAIESVVASSSSVDSPARAQTPPAVIARPRPKGATTAPTTSEISFTPAVVPAAVPTVPSPSAFNVPDIFDTSKFMDDAPAKQNDNPFKTMQDEDAGAEDFFAQFSTNKTTTASKAADALWLAPPKAFDALQTYTDDEGALADTVGAGDEGGFSSANNPFRATSPPAGSSDAFGASDDPFSQLAAIGGTSTAGGGGAEWDEFDPFAEKKPQAASEFKADFGGATTAAGKRANLKNKKEGSGSQDSSDKSVVEYDFDEDDALTPLKPFHEEYHGQWFQMGLRQPPKKSKMPFTGQRGWRTTYTRLEADPKNGNIFLRLYLSDKDATAGKNPLQELKLDPYMTLSEIGMQPFDEYGKVYTTKIYRTDYKERPALRPDKITPKGLGLTSIKDLKRLITKPKTTMILDHAPQHDELMKLGSLNYEELKQFRWYFEDAMMRVITKRAQTSQVYTKDEIIAEVIDEYEASVDKYGHITEQKARVRVYCLAFLSGMAFVEMGVNDIRRKGKEVVRRQDIIPLKTEQWIRIEDYQFHCCVNQEEFNKNTVIRLQPPDGINVEILRFRVRPRKNFQLPLQVRAQMNVDRTNREVEIRMEVLIPGYFSNSRKANQAPCENIAIAFPIPEPWIYYFRVEHVWGYGSVHAHKARPGKVKGLDRITNMAEGLIPKTANPTGCQMEVNTGDCKYEHLLNGLVWRIPRLPERFQGAYKTHLLTVKIPLGQHDPIPDKFEPFVTVDYTMPATSVSKAVIRSISSTSQADEPPDKWVKQLARYYYKVEVEYTDEVHSKGEAVEKPVTFELPASLAAGEKLQVRTLGDGDDDGGGTNEEPAERPAGLAVSDEDSSDEDEEDKAAAKRKAAFQNINLGAAATTTTPAASVKPIPAPASSSGLKVSDEGSDESEEDDDDEEERPKHRPMNPLIASFIQTGGAMANGRKKNDPPPQHPPQPSRPAPPHPPPPTTSKHPQSPGSGGGGGSDESDDDFNEHGKANPKRPPPPRPAAGPPPPAPPSASGGKKWTVIAEAEQAPKNESES